MPTAKPQASRPRKSAAQAAPPAPCSRGWRAGRIRERRKELGLSLQAVAARAGLTASFLSLIERNIGGPSLDSLRRIAEALEVPFFYFTQSNSENPLVRRNERLKITFPPGDIIAELLVPNLRRRLEVFISRPHPSAGNIARTPQHDSDECPSLLSGRLRVQLNGVDYALEPGDSIYFHGSAWQEIRALGKREAAFISIVTPPVL
jgi:transcriptional regulator with XRE-family HTH domain